MLWDNFHRFILFHHIQFQLLVLTATPNLKLNVTTAFQIICNLQKRSTAIMDRTNSTKSNTRNRNGRCSRSISSPSRSDNVGFSVHQRTNSHLALVGNVGNYWQTYPIHHSSSNSFFGDVAGCTYYQQPWNPNFFQNYNTCPMTSSSGLHGQYRRTHTIPPPRNCTPDMRNDKSKFCFILYIYNFLFFD